jgi:hypothetical protein
MDFNEMIEEYKHRADITIATLPVNAKMPQFGILKRMLRVV